MDLYLPIAGMAVDVPIMIGVGFAVGFLSGMLGVGGGFLITPLLTVLGIPVDVAVATGANHAVASSASGALTQWRRGNVDDRMGGLMLAGGVLGSILGVQALALLRVVGQADLAIAIAYVLLLGLSGLLMLVESVGAIWRTREGRPPPSERRRRTWLHMLPYKTRFPRSKLYMSVIPPLVLGCLVGFLSGIMGVGGGFLAVPVMVYALGMPTRVVVGTSLLLVLVTGAVTTVMQAWLNQTVDVLLAALLMAGGVVGAQLGSRFGQQVPAEKLRALLGLLILGVSLRVGYALVARPTDLYSIDAIRLAG